MGNNLLSTEEWAEAHEMHPASVRRAVAEGRLEGFKVGKRWVIPEDAELAPDKRIKSGNYIGVHTERTRKEKAKK